MTDPSNSTKDIRAFHAMVKSHGLPKPIEGEGSAFSERVAIKLDGESSYEMVEKARQEALNEYILTVQLRTLTKSK
jgi:hypothetical protein